MSEARRLTVPMLREIVSDAAELQKGTAIFDANGLQHLARYQNKLFCDAAGSGAAPYKVGITFGDDGAAKGRCSCMAARSRPFCKHAAGLLVAWARAPESFAVSETAPADIGGTGAAKKKSVKKGDASDTDLMRQGVERVGTLVRELGLAGTAALGTDRIEQIRALGQSLREHKLRRLSARILDLVGVLQRGQVGAVPPIEYMDVVADLLLTSRKLEKHLAGEALDDRYVEELIGKTWRKTDRTPVESLELVEYGFSTRTTSDDFVIRESRFVDIKTGEHYSEKQIVPAFLAKRTEPKRSHVGHVLDGARGGRYPGFAPLRLDLEQVPARTPLVPAVVERMAAVALPAVGAALSAFQERRKDVFAPPRVPVAVRVDVLLSRPGRALLVDQEGQALYLPQDSALEERLASLLRERRLQVLIGDVDIDAALPTLFPLAAIVEGPRGLELTSLSASAIAPVAAPTVSWARAAREANASAAAVSLAEIREELAFAFIGGLSTLVPRTTDPLVARLRDLGLEKQAALLDQIARRPDPAERLDDGVKLYHVLEIALVRLLAAAHVDRASLVRVPTFESVFIRRPTETLPPQEVAARRSRGELSRYEAATQYAAYYESLPSEQLAASIFPTWADGSASPYVVRAFAERGGAAIAAARRALGRGTSRVARMTAVRVLEAVGNAEARTLLQELRDERDVPLRMLAAEALEAIDARAKGRAAEPDVQRTGRRVIAEERLLNAPLFDERIVAIGELVRLGDRAALPALRNAFFSDVSGAVNECAAHALGHLLDVEMVDVFVRQLAEREQDESAAKAAAYALGYLGDARGLDALLSAWAAGWKPAIVGDALRAMGTVALSQLVLLLETRPDLAGRKAALDIFKQAPPTDVLEVLNARISTLRSVDTFAETALIHLKVAGANADAEVPFAKSIIDVLPNPETKAEKALVRSARRICEA
jgi:hypothetical protein